MNGNPTLLAVSGGNGVGSGTGTGTTSPTDHSQYWRDDFLPLQHAGKAVLRVLRSDESSAHGDLYRRILSTSTTASANERGNVNESSSSLSSNDMESIPNHYYFTERNQGVAMMKENVTNETMLAISDVTTNASEKRGVFQETTRSFSHVHSVPIPPYLQDQLPRARMSTMMGLFPHAQMAWLTIDDTIYLWSYHPPAFSDPLAPSESTTSEFVYFQVPSRQPIVSAALAPPKAGVFREMVEWCLVVTTKEEAMLCALARKSQEGLTLIRTKFIIPSDWIAFLSIASTPDGRIFLGGQDGNLYELDYDLMILESYASGSILETEKQLERFYDGVSTSIGEELREDWRRDSAITTQGKRIWQSIVNPSRQPPRKCRKLNHSQSSLSSFLPDFISNLSSSIFGALTTTGAGPIVNMVVDDERQVLYTLSRRGWICALDIAQKPKVTLAAILHTPATARLYLEAVSRGRMYAPSTSSSTEGNLAFPGGGEAAQAGVGGMEGARKILKLADSTKSNRRQSPTTSLLTPVSLHVVPNCESTRITLIAVTSGGLRYYISSLNPNTLGAGPSNPPFGTPRHRHPWRPHSKLTLCHIRAPPSLLEHELTSPKSQAPTVASDHRIDTACYSLGTFVAAFQNYSQDKVSTSGNILVASSPDSMARFTRKSRDESASTTTYVTPGGVCEVVSFPMALSGSSPTTPFPGGRIWDISAASLNDDKLLSLAMRSKTPSDTELGFGMAPAYVPPSKRVVTSNKSPRTDSPRTDSMALASSKTLSLSSLAFTVMTNLLLSRPARHGIDVQTSFVNEREDFPLYRLSNRSGVQGFSLSAADSKANGGTASTRSARLSPWLLTPATVPLSPMALQYLDRPALSFLAVNAGGLHYFQSPSILQQFSSAILAAGANARTDKSITRLFENYGYAEGCSMCLFLAMKPSSSANLKEYAMRAALSRAYRPTLLQAESTNQNFELDLWVPSGYSFSPSALYEGLTLAVARLLRPFWHKPVVVVTEGKVLRKGPKERTTPAKVEILMGDDVLVGVLSPLNAMQQVIARVFAKAIESVPLSKNPSTNADQMDIDDDNNHFLTRALEYQSRGQLPTSSALLRTSEADQLAQHIEERNIHSLFRLVSRTAQFLSLLSHMRRAQNMPDLPEVEWGQFHGITVSQFIQTREGQERIESTLNALVTASTSTRGTQAVSSDAKELARLLSEQCYHFFSPGLRYAYFGFQSAKEALSIPADQRSRRLGRTREAVDYLKRAAVNWLSPSLVTGRVLQAKDSESFDKIAERALLCDSPLAKSCNLLVDLEDVVSVVEICLLTASNFVSKPNPPTSSFHDSVVRDDGRYKWEKELYHKRHSADLSGTGASSSVAMGTAVTAKDAVQTCHALIFYHLTRLLDAPISTSKYQLGERMVSVCAASRDTAFLHSFYSCLQDRNHSDVLLRIDSPVLEEWLAKEQKNNLELLLRYYEIQEKHVQAGEVAWKRASDPDSNLSIENRIECLVHAVDSFSRAINNLQGDQSEVQQKLKQSKELLDIARLQVRVLQSMGSKDDVSTTDVKQLQEKLVSASDLLNEFAIPYEMYEACLHILHICKHTDVVHVQKFWKGLLCSEIFPCSTRSKEAHRYLCGFAEGSSLNDPVIAFLDEDKAASGDLFEDGSWMRRLELAVVTFGREIYGDGGNYVFPVDFIASCLEDLRRAYVIAVGSTKGRKTLGWMSGVLVSAGVEHLTALGAYERIINKENHLTMGAGPEQRLEQIQAIITMLEAFVDAARSGMKGSANSASEEMSNAYTSGTLLAGIEEYKSKLQSLPGDVSFEEERLVSLEASIKRQFG